MPQAFTPGDARINRNGRPRRLTTELERLRSAAQHVDRLLEQHALCDLLMGRKTPTPAPRELLRAGDALRAEIAEVEAAAELVESIMKNEWPENAGRRRRRRALGADAYEQAIQQAGRALDRICGEDNPQ